MVFWKKIIAVAALSVMLTMTYAGFALAGVSPEEADKLGGPVLTGVGAERAGNKDGTIPEYTGGLTKVPANYKMGSGIRPDPFAAEKPLFSITAQNMAQYADKLNEGTKGMLKKYPSFRADVYKTHRTIAYPQWVLDNTKKNAVRAKTTDGGLGISGAHAGFPFPLPKNAYEVMWNHLARYEGVSQSWIINPHSVDAAGRPSLCATSFAYQQYDYYDVNLPESQWDSCIYYETRVDQSAPARMNGEIIMLRDPLNMYKKKRVAYQYFPGLRRVKTAPELDYDTPNALGGGIDMIDDLWIFSGAMDRYDWKLLGKKEVYTPYNTYKVNLATVPELFTPKHPNPDLVRWELHRVWVVEATLKPQFRHLYHKRRIYIDEDSWTAVLDERYDANGKLYKCGWTHITPAYEYPCPLTTGHLNLDLLAGNYIINPWIGNAPNGHGYGIIHDKPWPADMVSAGNVVSRYSLKFDQEGQAHTAAVCSRMRL